ncbi:MAG: hypothetical protein AB7O96_06320 [Pseudobdellovibrionaceae bacterium]
MSFKYLISITLCIFSVQTFGSGTGVGNGGDPIFDFLEAARVSMVETLKIAAKDPEEKNKLCNSEKLEPEQIQFCREVLNSVSVEVLKLNQIKNRTPFVLRNDPLFVEGPDGKPMMVAARTVLGPFGTIEFHRDSVKTLTPVQVLFLISHEFLHKVPYQDHYISDLEDIGPFANGRHLLDSISSAIVTLAKKKKQVGTQFGIRDIFHCSSYVNDAHTGLSAFSLARMFASEDLFSYETSSGKNPNDGFISIPQDLSTLLRFKFVITEPNNCGPESPERKNMLQIVQMKRGPDNNYDETIIEELLLFENPMCPQATKSFGIRHQQFRFECTYYGSDGTTSGSLNRLRRQR